MEEKLASLIGDLTTDGHVQLGRRGVISFYAKDLSEIEKFNSEFNEIFGKSGNIFQDNRQGNIRYRLFISDKKLAKFLKQKGTPIGNKTNKIFSIPSWIMAGQKNIQGSYLQRIFDGEGSIFKQCDGRWRLTFTMNKSEELLENTISFFYEIKKLFNNFNIKTSNVWISEGKTRKDQTKSKTLKLEVKKQSLLDFYKQINFSNPQKKAKLEKAIKETFQ